MAASYAALVAILNAVNELLSLLPVILTASLDFYTRGHIDTVVVFVS